VEAVADAGGDEAGVGFRRRESPAEIRPCLVALYLPQSFPGMGWHQQGFGGGGGGLGVGAAAAAADGVRANIINEKNKLSMVDLLGFWIARLFPTGFTLQCARFQKPGPTFSGIVLWGHRFRSTALEFIE